MKQIINNKLIRSFNPCYDPAEIGISDNESLKIKDWVEKYRNTVNEKADIIWLLCRKEFMTDKDMRLFAVWCAREALKLTESLDPRSIDACDVAENFANGQCTQDELVTAWNIAWTATYNVRNAAARAANAAAWAAARDAAWAAAWEAANAAWEAAWEAARDAAWAAARAAQIEQLMTYF